MSDFMKKFGLFDKKSVTQEIRGQEFEFHPVCLRKIATGRMRDIMVPLTDSLSVLLKPRHNDVEKFEEVTPEGGVFHKQSAISREMAMYRDDKTAKAVKEAWGVLLNDETRYLIAEMLMDSLRDDCPRKPSDEEINQFIDHEDMDIPTIVSFIKGFMKANANVFGDTGKELAALVKAKIESVTKETLAEAQAPAEEASEEAPALKIVTDDKQGGEGAMPADAAQE